MRKPSCRYQTGLNRPDGITVQGGINTGEAAKSVRFLLDDWHPREPQLVVILIMNKIFAAEMKRPEGMVLSTLPIYPCGHSSCLP